MIRIFRPSTRLVAVSLTLVVGFGLGSCQGRNGSASSAANGEQQATPSLQTETVATTAETSAAGYQSTPIEPPRMAQLTSQQATAQIHVRSQPTTQSNSLGYGATGDTVQLLRLAEGEGGYSWYYLKFKASGEEGWIRGDFVDASGSTVAAAPATPTEDDSGSGACGRDRQEAYFETPSFSVYICNLGTGLRYVGIEKDTQESLVTEDVRNAQGIYIAIQDNIQCHINEDALAVYQINNGAYSQLVAEKVVDYEQFIY
jgi:hypothetical protein